MFTDWHRHGLAASMVTVFVVVFSGTVAAVEVHGTEMSRAKQFALESFGVQEQVKELQLPFGFIYNGQPSSQLLDKWQLKRVDRQLDEKRMQHILTYTDSYTSLAVTCVAVEYLDFPVVEWTMYFKNCGESNTPFLEGVRALDINVSREDEAGEYVLHHFKGSQADISDYQPVETLLSPKSSKIITPFGGRPTNGSFPYFNLELPGEAVRKVESKTAIYEKVVTESKPGRGMIIAVGWPGQWMAQFTRDEKTGLRILAGQETTHFVLHPGEEVRTPLVAVLFWDNDIIRAQNLWRQWMISHNLPHSQDGTVRPPQLTPCSSHQYGEMVNANEENQKLFVSRYLEEGLAPDYWWMDAGWYQLPKGRWVDTGTWEIDRKRFPNGFRPISDFAHSKGVKIIVWFEPERVCEGTWLWQNRPEWLLSPKELPESVGWMRQWKLLDLGNTAARKWLTDHIDKLLTEQGIDLYRQDFNIDPLWYWQSGDDTKREGITENFYVQGYLAYWDELKRRHPGMLIDSCASGGRRNDLETLRRAVPLLRSDYIFEEVGQQCHNYVLSMWMPYHGTGTKDVSPYHFWSVASPHLIPCWDLRDKTLDYVRLRKWIRQWRQIAKYYYYDYYPLTPYSLKKDVWVAWQFNSPEGQGGMVQAFRRNNSYTLTAELQLQGLISDAEYEINDILAERRQTVSGHDLITNGLDVTIGDRPGVAVLEYRKVSH